MAKQIKASAMKKFEGKQCPACRKGDMVHALKHDAMAGNSSVLQCTNSNPCGLTIEIVPDK